MNNAWTLESYLLSWQTMLPRFEYSTKVCTGSLLESSQTGAAFTRSRCEFTGLRRWTVDTLDQLIYFTMPLALRWRLRHLHRFLQLPLTDYVCDEARSYNPAMHVRLGRDDHRLRGQINKQVSEHVTTARCCSAAGKSRFKAASQGFPHNVCGRRININCLQCIRGKTQQV